MLMGTYVVRSGLCCCYDARIMCSNVCMYVCMYVFTI